MAANKSDVNKKVASRPKLILYICSICILLLTAILFLFSYNRLPPEVPLYYGKPPGAKQIANKNLLLLPIALSFVIAGVNYLLSSLTKDQYLRYIFAALSVLVSLISAVTVIKIILLVGNL